MIDPDRVDTLGHVALLVLLSASAALVAQTEIRPMAATARETADFRAGVETLARADADLEHLNDEIKDVAEALAATDAMLPEAIDLDLFLRGIGDLAERTGVRIERLIPSQVSEHSLFRELVLEMDISGPFAAIGDFLMSVESAPQLSRVDHLRITRDGAGNGCSAKLGLALYYAPEGSVDRG
jgi:Tfp pilus assembly protein PilO